MKFIIDPHVFVYEDKLRRQICKKCGLVRLNNEFTEWAVRLGCNNNKHPNYENMRKTLGRK